MRIINETAITQEKGVLTYRSEAFTGLVLKKAAPRVFSAQYCTDGKIVCLPEVLTRFCAEKYVPAEFIDESTGQALFEGVPYSGISFNDENGYLLEICQYDDGLAEQFLNIDSFDTVRLAELWDDSLRMSCEFEKNEDRIEVFFRAKGGDIQLTASTLGIDNLVIDGVVSDDMLSAARKMLSEIMADSSLLLHASKHTKIQLKSFIKPTVLNRFVTLFPETDVSCVYNTEEPELADRFRCELKKLLRKG